ncbi:MAG: ATP-binding cassette domain-containing protein, partial [Myxococcaceae bacterium]
MFQAQKVSFSYEVGGRKVDVLKNLDFSVKAGEFVGIQGPSGSGKSTLFYLLGFLLKPTAGKIIFDGVDITSLSADELAVIRNRRIGFIFQQFHLLANSSCLKNILLPTLYPAELSDSNPKQIIRAQELAKNLGLSEHLSHFPNQLSGGQQQRVAIARALIHDVELILADEPTGNLDSKTAAEIMEQLRELNRQGKTIILITHDSEVAKYCSKVYHLKDGAFTHVQENYVQNLKAQEVFLKPPKLPKRVYFKLFRATLPLVFENLLRNKTKSLLTMLGVVIGVAAVLAMITLGQFSKTKILETYEALGVNKVLIWGYANPNMRATDSVSINFRSFNIDKDLMPLRQIFK